MKGEHLVEALLRHAADQPSKVAIAWLPDGEHEAMRLTYAELVERVRACAETLQARGLQGRPVMIALPPGPDYLMAVLASMFAGAVAVPMPEQRAGTPGARWAAVMTKVGDAPVIDTPIMPGDSGAWRPPSVGDQSIAFVQFTSGSTGAPKGVVIGHRALTENRAMIREAFAHDPDWRCLTWLPPWHDMGLVGGLLQPLGEGMFVAMLPPLAIVQRPVRWLRSIERYRATVSGGPLFAYAACLNRVSDADAAALDLSSWKLAYCGAEPVRAAPLTAFAKKFSASGFDERALYPCYGLAEATLFVTGPERGAGVRTFQTAGRTLVSCGGPRLSGRVRIADPVSGATLPQRTVGEICIGGENLTSGYWGEGSAPAELRTGDFGLLHEGDLFVVGRMDDLLILHGAKHHAEDLEDAAMTAHPTVRAAAAFAIDNGERLGAVAVVEAHPRVSAEDVRRSVAATVLRQCGVRLDCVHVVPPGRLPRTTSGKIERHRCRTAFASALASHPGERA